MSTFEALKLAYVCSMKKDKPGVLATHWQLFAVWCPIWDIMHLTDSLLHDAQAGHFMAFDMVSRFLFFTKGWWNTGIFILRAFVALITDIFALYFCTATIISFSESRILSDLVLIRHSFTVLLIMLGFFQALWYTSSFPPP